ncbi:IS3 family transposase [Ligilactobacillus sp. WILCCON 0076]|uniref:IS3 family transposase n=1 Tax=Ligilactobacillus ubinensis TaxID=2876789 RepID=A0A9X2FLC6_9LACO|nr:IS3 family transposase [Ligilactobacillus ubinensis]
MHYQISDYQVKPQILQCECLNCCKFQNINNLTIITEDYIQWFNNERISLKIKDLSLVEYRKHLRTFHI